MNLRSYMICAMLMVTTCKKPHSKIPLGYFTIINVINVWGPYHLRKIRKSGSSCDFPWHGLRILVSISKSFDISCKSARGSFSSSFLGHIHIDRQASFWVLDVSSSSHQERIDMKTLLLDITAEGLQNKGHEAIVTMSGLVTLIQLRLFFWV